MSNIKIKFNGSICKIEGLSEDVIEAIKYRFRLDLSSERYQDFVNKTKLPLTQEGESIYLVEHLGKTIHIPTGLLMKLTAYLKLLKYDYQIEKKIVPTALDYKSHIACLREDQLECVSKALKFKRGIIKAYTRFGKSLVTGDFLNQFSNETFRLIIVPKVDLLYQMRKDIAKWIGLNEDDLGLIGDSNFNLKPITIAIPDTLAIKIADLDSETINYLNKVQVVVMDEIHRLNNPTTSLVSDYLVNTEYRIGLSATPYVDNFLILEGMLGNVIVEKTEKDGMTNGVIDNPTLYFHKLESTVKLTNSLSNFKFNSGSFGPKEMKIYNTLYDQLICLNSGRNNLGIEIVLQRLKEGRTVVILVKKVGNTGGVKHSEIIRNLLLEKEIDFPIVSGVTKNRSSYFEKLDSGELKGIIASTGILTDGVTLRSVSSLVMMCAGSEKKAYENTKQVKDFVQRVGRTLTKDEGKLKPVIDDFMDNQSIFVSQSESRIKAAISTYGKENVIIL